MRGWKIRLTPEPDGCVTIHLQAVDDAGHVLSAWATAKSKLEVASVIQEAKKSMATLAAKYTEEEGVLPF